MTHMKHDCLTKSRITESAKLSCQVPNVRMRYEIRLLFSLQYFLVIPTQRLKQIITCQRCNETATFCSQLLLAPCQSTAPEATRRLTPPPPPHGAKHPSARNVWLSTGHQFHGNVTVPFLMLGKRRQIEATNSMIEYDRV